MECTQNLGQIIWKLIFYLLKLSLRKVIWKKYINEFKMLILELLEEGKKPYWWKNKFSVEVMISYRYIKIDEYFRRNI